MQKNNSQCGYIQVVGLSWHQYTEFKNVMETIQCVIQIYSWAILIEAPWCTYCMNHQIFHFHKLPLMYEWLLLSSLLFKKKKKMGTFATPLQECCSYI